nr:MAG TPA: hypothetical protein [Bacteriophage sp.]
MHPSSKSLDTVYRIELVVTSHQEIPMLSS